MRSRRTVADTPTDAWRDHADARRRERQAAALAGAVPYGGDIITCQASVPQGGRMVGFRRCQQRARLVVRRAESERNGDGRLAMCRTHAANQYSSRYIANSTWDQASTTQPVEPDYQP
jgi:hypothetical protein